jgi:hypothetical protein
MGEIRGVVAKEIEEKFRRLAMRRFGYRKGSLSKALEVALLQWIQKSDLEDSDSPSH